MAQGTQTLANGVGLGGQLNYFGLFVGADFLKGHSQANPVSSTYGNPRLSKLAEFDLEDAEVWLIRPVEKDDRLVDDRGPGIYAQTEVAEFLEMSGKKMYGKEVRESKEDEYA